MTPPIFISNGLVRSGSTWSFNVCRKLANELAVQRSQPSASAYLDQNGLDQFLKVASQAVKGPTVIKAHIVGPLAIQWIRLGHAKAVCTYRDPRDSVASDLTFLGWDFHTVVRRVGSNLECLRQYFDCPNVLMVRYEDMMKDTLGSIRRIASHLSVHLPDSTLRRIDGETNRQSSIQICQQLKHRDIRQVEIVVDHRVDPATQLHDNHISSSKVGRWMDELSTDQGDHLTRLFQPWLLRLGYETPRSLQQRGLDANPVHAHAWRQTGGLSGGISNTTAGTTKSS